VVLGVGVKPPKGGGRDPGRVHGGPERLGSKGTLVVTVEVPDQEENAKLTKKGVP